MKYFYWLLFLLFSLTAIAQDYDFGKISKEELLEKTCSIDSTANAAILYQYRNTYFSSNAAGLTLTTQIQKRIKIYNKEGFDHATELIDLFVAGTSDESVSRIKAYTYNLEGNKIIETQLEKDQIFKDKISYSYNQIKFTMPNVKEGSVIEFKYEITSPFIWSINEFVFQSDIPIKKVEARLKTPEGCNFNQTTKGNIFFYPKRSSDYSSDYKMNMAIITYSLDNVPALKEESYVDNIQNYRAGAMFELVSIQIPGMFHQNYAQTWGEVARTIGSSDDYKNQLDKTNSFDDILDELIANTLGQEEKMQLIFKYVKDNITWNGIDGKSFHQGIKKTLNEKKGNTADINLTLVAMLRYAGIDANPVVISTKDHVIPYFPTVDRLNYVIAYAVIDSKEYFLDATEEFSDINVLPIKDYNWKGILIDNNKSIWKKIDISEPELAMSQYLIKAELSDDGSIKGEYNSKCSMHKAYEFRKSYKDKDLESFITSREQAYQNIEITDYIVENVDSYEGLVIESFNFLKENATDVIDNKIYIQPFLFFKINENPFKLKERLFPVDFGYPFMDRYIVNIPIPEGYDFESNIEPVIMKIPNDLGEFRFYPSIIGNSIQLSVLLKINKAIISADNYLFLKEFYNQMIIKQNEQIVLTKK